MREIVERINVRAARVAPTRGEYIAYAPEAMCSSECGCACSRTGRRYAFAPRVRSGLAHAAGFAGIAVLFRPSLATLLLWHLGIQNATVLMLYCLTGIVAPLALGLSFHAAVKLDRSPGLSGRPQALLGFFAGLTGTIGWLAEIDSWLTFIGR